VTVGVHADRDLLMMQMFGLERGVKGGEAAKIAVVRVANTPSSPALRKVRTELLVANDIPAGKKMLEDGSPIARFRQRV
jgi:hypothetical protein